MPFYEYQCSACGHRHEELQRVGDGPLRKCPACGRSRLRRLVSAPVFRLKGGGWYETDFKGDKEDRRNIAGEEAPPAEKPKEEKAEAKTADKTPAADKPEKALAADKKPKPEAAKPAPKSTPARRGRARRRSGR